METNWNDCSDINKENKPNKLHSTISFTVDMNLLKNMLILSGQRIEGLEDREIIEMGLNKLIPFGFCFGVKFEGDKERELII